MAGFTFATFRTAIAQTIVRSETNADFLAIFPTAIEVGEQRCYTDLDILGVTITDTSTTFSANARTATIPTPAAGRFVVIEGVNAVISGQRYPLTPVSRDWMDWAWPTASAPTTTSVPTKFAMISDTSILIGPPLGSSAGTATAEYIGKIRPNTLSASNTTTYLSVNYPQLFFAATMVFLAGWMKNYGAQADDPRQGVSWEQQYKEFLRGCTVEEARKRFASMDWTSAAPAPIAEASNAA